MKTLNAKRIAAVVAGAALLGVGLAFAGSITFQNVPIISNSGQPVVQIVLGSNAKAADGVTAANIAAAIGNLAYTSVPVTAQVNQTQAHKVLGVSVSSSSYTLTSQQVWLNESGSVSAGAGTYLFSALIGSVLNQGVALGSPASTKTLQASTTYAYQETSSISGTTPSPYTTTAYVPYVSVSGSTNGGGVSFSGGFSTGTAPNVYDNLLQLSSTQLSGLLSNWGGNGETEYLWLTGFPVFNQGSPTGSVNQFELVGAGGAYQAKFGTPIQNTTSSNSLKINVPIRFLGQNYTILSEVPATGSGASSTTVVAGGKLKLASSLIPLTTLYVGHNITTGPWTVQLTDLGQPNVSGVSPASLSIMYNNVLTNTTSLSPGTGSPEFNVSGHTIYINVNSTFAGLYAYQKWAKIQLYTNVFNVTNAKVFNQTYDPGWDVYLLWTNTTGGTKPKALQSIIAYNTTPVNLQTGQSFTFMQSPQVYKVTFLGETLGTGNFDTVTLATSAWGPTAYQNEGTDSSVYTNITEPAQVLTVSSGIPNAFSYAGQTGSSVSYVLTPYELNYLATNSSLGSNAIATNTVTLSYVGSGNAAANYITATNPLTVTITGYKQVASVNSPITSSYTFTANSQTYLPSVNFFNVTGIQVSRALPGGLTVTVNSVSSANSANTVTLATLKDIGPAAVYTQSGKNYYMLSTVITGTSGVVYNQQNGQPPEAFSLYGGPASAGASGSENSVNTALNVGQYFQYYMTEGAVSTNTAALDTLAVGLDNASSVTASPLFDLNYSVSTSATSPGKGNNVSYVSTQGTALNAVGGFRTEKGSKVASISPTVDTFNLAKAQDELQFSVSSFTSNTPTKSYKSYGPYGVGQATNIPNVTIGPVTATIKVGTANFSVSGIANLTATPSVTTATQPVLLKNLTTTPLVVLDSQANSGSNLILIGSGYVNALSAQLQSAYNISMTPTTQLSQAYGTNRVLIAGYYANQTTAAGNSFIQQLYAQAQ